MSDGKSGYATTLTGSVSLAIGQIMSISGPDQTADVIDVSTMDSPQIGAAGAGFREKIVGILRSGELTFELVYADDTDSTALDAALRDTTGETWTIAFGGTLDTWVCFGYVSALGYATPHDDKITQSVTIKFTGVPVYTDLAA